MKDLTREELELVLSALNNHKLELSPSEASLLVGVKRGIRANLSGEAPEPVSSVDRAIKLLKHIRQVHLDHRFHGDAEYISKIDSVLSELT